MSISYQYQGRSYRYLASPYSHPDKSVMERRYHEAKTALSILLSRKVWVYSPIVHCHQMAVDHSLPTDAEFWKEYNYTMIDASEGVWVLCIDGWRQSLGILDELKHAAPRDDTRYISPAADYEPMKADDYVRFLMASERG